MKKSNILLQFISFRKFICLYVIGMEEKEGELEVVLELMSVQTEI